MIKRIFLKLHLYLGLPLGLLLSVICLTGATLVFKDEINELIEPSVYFTERQADTKALPIETLIGLVEQSRPGTELGSVVVPTDPERNIQLKLRDEHRTTLYVDPYTAEVKGEKTRGSFFTDVMRLHRWLLGSRGSTGQYIVAYGTLGFILIVLSGIILWIPKNKKQLKASLRIKFNATRQRLLRDLHISLGFYLALALIVLSFTGLFFSPIKWVGKTINALAGTPEKTEGGKPKEREQEQSEPADARIHWDAVASELAKREPQARSITLEPTKAVVSLYHGWGNMRANNEYNIDAASGTLTPTKIYAEQPAHTKVRGWVYTIHVGAWGGLFSKVLTFLIALLAGTLPLTGYYLYIKKRQAPRKRHKK